jgi:hypothetical protein
LAWVGLAVVANPAEAGGGQDAADRASACPMAQADEFALGAPMAPPVGFPREAEDQVADVRSDWWTAGLVRVSLSVVLVTAAAMTGSMAAPVIEALSRSASSVAKAMVRDNVRSEPERSISLVSRWTRGSNRAKGCSSDSARGRSAQPQRRARGVAEFRIGFGRCRTRPSGRHADGCFGCRSC